MPCAWLSHDGHRWLPCRAPTSAALSQEFQVLNQEPPAFAYLQALRTSHLTTYSHLPEFLPLLEFPTPASPCSFFMPTLHHSCRHTQLHTGSATNPGSADVFCGSTHVPASVPITFFLHSHMKLSCSIWPVCALPSSGLALPGLMATWSWFRSPQWSPINAEPRLNTNLSGWPLDLQGDSTWWINTAVVSTMQLILYLIPPFHGSLLPWINTPKAPSLVSRACLRLQVQAGSQAPTAWASRSFLNPGIYQGKKCPGKAGNRALLSNSAVCLMEKRESITWRNTNKIPWENKEYFIYSGFRQPLSFCLQCSLKNIFPSTQNPLT